MPGAAGELLQMHDAWSWPYMQRTTYKLLGFPIPYLPLGKWGLLQLPQATPLYYVLGEPLRPPPLLPGEGGAGGGGGGRGGGVGGTRGRGGD